MAKRVLMAMSGGVDSSVAAALLLREGYEVVGVTMQVWPELDPAEEARRGGCCSLSAVGDARRVADILGIPYYVLNMREVFEREVIEYFVAEYARGRTPNPCIACNRMVKFRALMERAEALDCELLATGHYARAFFDPARGRHILARGLDPQKDQSYVLYDLTQEILARTLFPLGGYRKEEVRRLAAELGLPVWGKPDSQEICFVEDDAHGAFVAARAPEAARPGPILDRAGRALGTHRGLAHYTVGQRRGLGLAAPRPLYVVEIDAARNALVVATEEDAYRSVLEVEGVNWVAGTPPPGAVETLVQVRAHTEARPAEVTPLPEGRARVVFRVPQRGLAPGQAAVFYDGEEVLGGGPIARVAAPLPAHSAGRAGAS